MGADGPMYEQELPAFAADWLQTIVEAIRAGELKLTNIDVSTCEKRPEGGGVYSLTLRLVAPTGAGRGQ